jgi:hypothetical protein
LAGGLAVVAPETPAHATDAAVVLASPTDGWTQKSFTYTMQKPWNLSLSQRYRYDSASGTHTMWVNATDEPISEGSATDIHYWTR